MRSVPRLVGIAVGRRSTHSSRGPMRSVPPCGSRWVRLAHTHAAAPRTHPLPRGGTDLIGTAPIAFLTVHTTSAISRYRQNALANSICLGVLHCTSNNPGFAISTVTHCAREVATFSRFEL